MTDDNGNSKIAGSIGVTEDDGTTHAPNAVGPNVEFAIAPTGLIRVSFATGILMSAFYCDSQAARIMSTLFADMADKLDEAHEQLRALNEFTVLDTADEDDTIQEAEIVEVVAVEPDELLEDDNSLNGR